MAVCVVHHVVLRSICAGNFATVLLIAPIISRGLELKYKFLDKKENKKEQVLFFLKLFIPCFNNEMLSNVQRELLVKCI